MRGLAKPRWYIRIHSDSLFFFAAIFAPATCLLHVTRFERVKWQGSWPDLKLCVLVDGTEVGCYSFRRQTASL